MKLFDSSVTSPRETDDNPPSSSSSVSIEGGSVGFRTSPECSSSYLHLIPVLHSLGGWVAAWKSFFIVSSKFPPHLLLCLCYSCGCCPSCWSVPHNWLWNPLRWHFPEGFRTASLNAGVHHSLWGLLSLEAPKALRPQDPEPETFQAWNIDSFYGPCLHRDEGWGLKVSQTGASPQYSQLTHTTRLGLQGLF